MRALLSYLILPIPVFLMLIILSAILYWKRKKKASRVVLIISGLWFLAISTSFLPDLLVNLLEKQYPVLQIEQLGDLNQKTNILVLGAGHADDPKLESYDQLSCSGLYRISEGVRLQKLLPNSTLITSGTSRHATTTQAEVMRNTALMFGASPEKVKMQKEPRNTHQEAVAYSETFGKETRLILVTSATHMLRSMKLCQKEGLDPIPAPTDHQLKKDINRRPLYYFPSPDNIKKLNAAVHEFAGLVLSRFQ